MSKIKEFDFELPVNFQRRFDVFNLSEETIESLQGKAIVSGQKTIGAIKDVEYEGGDTYKVTAKIDDDGMASMLRTMHEEHTLSLDIIGSEKGLQIPNARLVPDIRAIEGEDNDESA